MRLSSGSRAQHDAHAAGTDLRADFVAARALDHHVLGRRGRRWFGLKDRSSVRRGVLGRRRGYGGNRYMRSF